jgi:hypothetical protein
MFLDDRDEEGSSLIWGAGKESAVLYLVWITLNGMDNGSLLTCAALYVRFLESTQDLTYTRTRDPAFSRCELNSNQIGIISCRVTQLHMRNCYNRGRNSANLTVIL